MAPTYSIPKRARRRVVVVGGGFAGLLAARMLTTHYDEIVVLERDRYPRLSKIHRIPWFFATAEDVRWPCTQGYGVGRIGRLVHRYLDGIIAAVTDIPEVDETLARVVPLLEGRVARILLKTRDYTS